MNFFMNLLMLLMAVLSVSARASPESCPLLKRRLMQTFQVQASEATISGRQAEVSPCNVIEFYSFDQTEFEDCLSQVIGDLATEGEGTLLERRECFRLFWHEVDANGDQKVDKDEFIRWKKL
ncbi:uncharacterized protein LOC108673611 [Hyalella azteca]|uniref:Uncharacterized protein LOC108673611 n=1 Tax=Hyalella azteca TaxID=294128 RepID=A0A8B7NVJ3_HYAAZ|nr:uncharacterized protein LOC108673611 [Hyalella azteca]